MAAALNGNVEPDDLAKSVSLSDRSSHDKWYFSGCWTPGRVIPRTKSSLARDDTVYTKTTEYIRFYSSILCSKLSNNTKSEMFPN